MYMLKKNKKASRRKKERNKKSTFISCQSAAIFVGKFLLCFLSLLFHNLLLLMIFDVQGKLSTIPLGFLYLSLQLLNLLQSINIKRNFNSFHVISMFDSINIYIPSFSIHSPSVCIPHTCNRGLISLKSSS